MMKRLLVGFAILSTLLISSVFVLPAERTYAVAQGCTNSFLGLPAWYKYLESTGPPECDITGPKDGDKFNWPKAAGFVAIAVFESLLRVAALIAVIYVVYGGFRYIASQGEPENAKNARQTIINALIGVVIAVAAASIVSFIMQQLTSPISTPTSGGTGTIEELRGRMT